MNRSFNVPFLLSPLWKLHFTNQCFTHATTYDYEVYKVKRDPLEKEGKEEKLHESLVGLLFRPITTGNSHYWTFINLLDPPSPHLKSNMTMLNIPKNFQLYISIFC